MLTERQPLGQLDLNAPRVQPSRAAKTGHKWLCLRRSKNIRDDNLEANSSRLGCVQIKKPILRLEDTKAVRTQQHDNNHALVSSDIYRLPLRDITGGTNVENELPNCQIHKSRFFPPLHVSQSSVESMSIDTSSDSSFRSADGSDLVDEGDSSHKLLSPRHSNHKEPSTLGHLSEDLCLLDEYLVDILTCLRDTEAKYMPNPCYLEEQSEITAPMRVKLVDWLVEVQDEYKLHNETLHLAVAFVDRFLSTMSVTRSKLQLLGTTAMFLAAKFEEICPPDADEFAYVTADTYTRSEVLMMERLILRVFDFRLAVPTAHQYLMIFSEKSGIIEEIVLLSHYLCELALLDHLYLNYPPSVRAAAALTLALFTFDRQTYSTLQNLNEFIRNAVIKPPGSKTTKQNHFTVFPQAVRLCMQDKLSEVYECASSLAKTHRKENDKRQCFVCEKHSTGKLKCVLKIQPHLVVNDSSTMSWSDLMRPWNP